MEQNLDKLLDDTMEGPGVMGVICADKQGLCYSAKGTVSVGSAGIIASLSQQAALLVPESSSAPVICLESDKGNVLIKTHQDVTIAIHKMPTY
ncbi:ragulator complex protein LAMTOR5 [Strongylocentrotus purpuratus]|uniref:Late endosomal/lysosomal adaptor and MAPK and MTOR activator 5 n=1 Tax=Strongylocentrotus purpuratus TaxID=7668 RepID=A0A7M7TGG4_STRPU|nr:ragulator complex protein LAMTOR5 [Strongylocentrotus purpuratus]|eukprot:XP_783035.2 PREDICTED: ragulator complex protein LAMTOR5 [Strongylocentrotus purpuratus]